MPEHRRSLSDGLELSIPSKANEIEKEFVYGESPRQTLEPKPLVTPAKTPLTTRLRGDYAKALQRASLERKLNDEHPHTVQDIIEEALEQWFQEHGYLN